MPSSHNDSSNDIGLARITRMISLPHDLNENTSAKCLLPWQVTDPQVLGIRMWALLGAIILLTTGSEPSWWLG